MAGHSVHDEEGVEMVDHEVQQGHASSNTQDLRAWLGIDPGSTSIPPLSHDGRLESGTESNTPQTVHQAAIHTDPEEMKSSDTIRSYRWAMSERVKDSSSSLEDDAGHRHRRSASSRTALGKTASGTSLSPSPSRHGLSQQERTNATPSSIQRTPSVRSNPGTLRGRSSSSAVQNPNAQPISKRPSLHERTFYPDQSYASIQHSALATRPNPTLRTRSSHPAQNILYNDIAKHAGPPPVLGHQTADNTPLSSPGLFTPHAIRVAQDARTASPQLHHLQAPKETNVAEVEHDTFSGNKFINNYEVVRELGRGEHGKVKLGRDIDLDVLVAIKIVPRYSAKRRLGKLGAPEDRTKKEVAILKKARHPNVVSLLEVIDDPSKNKVYLILEYVDWGEIRWRKEGAREINGINNRRFALESHGALLPLEPEETDLHYVRQAQQRQNRREHLIRNPEDHIPNWSLEYSGDTDEESDHMENSRSLSRQLTHQSGPSRRGSIDDYVGVEQHIDQAQSRKWSLAPTDISHISSEHPNWDEDDQHAYVPALTMEEARRSFRDTLLGLEFLHHIGIIHRDIKPANLLVSSSGQVKISDFGVSYLGRPINEDAEEHKALEADAQTMDDEKELARSVGTPAFWAPELCYEDTSMFEDGKEPKITGALDLWALGITLYCMIYARLPFYTTDTMGLHEAVCVAELICPRTRLVAVCSRKDDESNEPLAPNKRKDFELKFEHVPDELRQLINQLLIKDPAKRITIADAKKHAWTKEGIIDYSEWMQGPLPTDAKKDILEPNKEELSHAVSKRSFIDRAIDIGGKIAGTLLGRTLGRDRSSSTVASAAGSSTESLSPTTTHSTLGRGEMRSKDARRTSVRGDELVQALRASRDGAGEHPLAQSQTASPDFKQNDHSYFPSSTSTASDRKQAQDSVERRPAGPDRTLSTMSTTESIKTIRASHFHSQPLAELVESAGDTQYRSRLDGLWEGNTRTMARLASADRGHVRSRSTSRAPSEGDGHADASLAVSTEYAAGAIATPDALRANGEPQLEPQSSQGAGTTFRHVPVHAPESSEMEYEQAQLVNQRRQIQELESLTASLASQTDHPPLAEPCPPSPDDLQDGGMQTAASASTIASSAGGFDNSSMSNPSFGIASGASSPPDYFIHEHQPAAHTSETEPEHMRTADTMIPHGKPLQREHEYYADDGDDEGDSSDDDELIMMGGSRP